MTSAATSTPVSRHGQLRVEGTKLVGQHGQPVQLRGVSFGWHNMWPRFYRSATVGHLASDWGADVVRCPIGLSLEEGQVLDINPQDTFDHNPALGYACVDSIVTAAIHHGVYVIVDFHSHPNNLPLAKEFFATVAQKYGHVPNVIYEIWNEPTEVPWAEAKQYAEELLPIIRQHAPEAIVIVPTPRWDQEVDAAADDPITGYHNLMYSLHYYAATHTQYLRDKAAYALSKGLPLFMSECAAMLHTGDGVIDTAEWEQWMQLANDNDISWCAWSIADKKETCSMLRPSAASAGCQWTTDDLKPWAVLVKYYLAHGRNN